MSETPEQNQAEPDPGGPIPMSGGPQLVSHLPVSILMRVTPLPDHRWLDQRVETVAVLPRASNDSPAEPPTTNQAASNEPRIIRYDALAIDLHADECESYYFNLMVDDPRCFVAYKNLDEATPEPFVVTPSYDLAASYEEGDQRVDAVPLDPALYPQIEAFVLAHYAPEKKIKRKRRDWRKG